MALDRILCRLKDDHSVTKTLSRRSLQAWGHMWEPVEDSTGDAAEQGGDDSAPASDAGPTHGPAASPAAESPAETPAETSAAIGSSTTPRRAAGKSSKE
ncbi:hypothetical protein [Actinomadura litoris]|uniref:hypothetical protein n=1 Tax=Actinomadura litoris TaxID=2678616 RepID=UPI001FA77A2B|nr:hypothetical protein [Actinomadura litoris]